MAVVTWVTGVAWDVGAVVAVAFGVVDLDGWKSACGRPVRKTSTTTRITLTIARMSTRPRLPDLFGGVGGCCWGCCGVGGCHGGDGGGMYGGNGCRGPAYS